MIKNDDLKGVIAKNGMFEFDIEKLMEVMLNKNRDFSSDEIQIIIDKLHIKNSAEIFCYWVTLKDTNYSECGERLCLFKNISLWEFLNGF